MNKEVFKSININGINYKLKLVAQSNPELGKDNRGITDFEQLKILLGKNYAPDLRVKTFYHELAHALCESTSFNNELIERFTNIEFECFIDQLGEAIQLFIQNNDYKDIENFVRNDEH